MRAQMTLTALSDLLAPGGGGGQSQDVPVSSGSLDRLTLQRGPLSKGSALALLACMPTLAQLVLVCPFCPSLPEPGFQLIPLSQCCLGTSRSLGFPIWTRGLAVAQHWVVRQLSKACCWHPACVAMYWEGPGSRRKGAV